METADKVALGLCGVVFFGMMLSILFPLGELVGIALGSDYYEDCGCEDVKIDAESTNAVATTGHIFDVEQIGKPVVRMLVEVPEETQHEYLVVKVEWLTEDNRVIKQQREFVRVKNDKVQIVDIEREDKMEYAPRMRVKPMGWTNNEESGEVWEPDTS